MVDDDHRDVTCIFVCADHFATLAKPVRPSPKTAAMAQAAAERGESSSDSVSVWATIMESQMTLMFDVDDLATRLPEMLAEVEAGRDVVIARGAVPLATVKRKPRRPSPEDVERAIEDIKEIRRGIPPTTAEEILAWRDEGRRR